MDSSPPGGAVTAPDLYAWAAELAPDALIEVDPALPASLPADCLLTVLGITPTHLGRGRCRAEMIIGRQHLNQRGIVQAGALISFADATAGWAAYTATESGRFTTLDLSANLLRAAREGDRLVAVARPVHTGRATQVFDVEVTSTRIHGTAALVARMTCTQIVLGEQSENPA